MVDDQTPEAAPEPEPTPEPAPEPPAEPQPEPVSAADAPPAADPAAPAAPVAGADDPAQENPIMAALAYPIPLIGLIILLTDMKKSRYMRFHGLQALFLVAGLVVVSIAAGVLSFLPMVGCIASAAGGLVGLAWLIVAIIAAVKAYNKQDWLAPGIGQMASDQADKMRV